MAKVKLFVDYGEYEITPLVAQFDNQQVWGWDGDIHKELFLTPKHLIDYYIEMFHYTYDNFVLIVTVYDFQLGKLNYYWTTKEKIRTNKVVEERLDKGPIYKHELKQLPKEKYLEIYEYLNGLKSIIE